MNQKPYNTCLINLVCSVCTGKYLPSVLSHSARSFVALSVRKPPVQTSHLVNKSFLYFRQMSDEGQFHKYVDFTCTELNANTFKQKAILI